MYQLEEGEKQDQFAPWNRIMEAAQEGRWDEAVSASRPGRGPSRRSNTTDPSGPTLPVVSHFAVSLPASSSKGSDIPNHTIRPPAGMQSSKGPKACVLLFSPPQRGRPPPHGCPRAKMPPTMRRPDGGAAATLPTSDWPGLPDWPSRASPLSQAGERGTARRARRPLRAVRAQPAHGAAQSSPGGALRMPSVSRRPFPPRG